MRTAPVCARPATGIVASTAIRIMARIATVLIIGLLSEYLSASCAPFLAPGKAMLLLRGLVARKRITNRESAQPGNARGFVVDSRRRRINPLPPGEGRPARWMEPLEITWDVDRDCTPPERLRCHCRRRVARPPPDWRGRRRFRPGGDRDRAARTDGRPAAYLRGVPRLAPVSGGTPAGARVGGAGTRLHLRCTGWGLIVVGHVPGADARAWISRRGVPAGSACGRHRQEAGRS